MSKSMQEIKDTIEEVHVFRRPNGKTYDTVEDALKEEIHNLVVTDLATMVDDILEEIDAGYDFEAEEFAEALAHSKDRIMSAFRHGLDYEELTTSIAEEETEGRKEPVKIGKKPKHEPNDVSISVREDLLKGFVAETINQANLLYKALYIDRVEMNEDNAKKYLDLKFRYDSFTEILNYLNIFDWLQYPTKDKHGVINLDEQDIKIN